MESGLHDRILDISVDHTTRYGIVLSVTGNNDNYFYEWVDVIPFFKNVEKEELRYMDDKKSTTWWCFSYNDVTICPVPAFTSVTIICFPNKKVFYEGALWQELK